MSPSRLKQKMMSAALAVVAVGCAATEPELAAPPTEAATSSGAMMGAGTSASAPHGSAMRAPGFTSLAPAMGEPLPARGTSLTPPAPKGWVWYEIQGAVCRDGSPTGFYVHYAASDKLLWFLEHGGACTSPGFCGYNPKNVNERFPGDAQTVLGSFGGSVASRQQPGSDGIFDIARADNPFRDWNMIYVPYCTGDIHFGTKRDATVPGLKDKQQFVGHFNMQKFTSRIVPTFKGKVDRVVLAGSSAGGFGAILNYSMVQDAFDDVPVVLLDDSAPSFFDRYLPVCMQQKWRNLWGLDASLPSDCKTCFQADGGNLTSIWQFLIDKHPGFRAGLVSTLRDDIIRLFFSAGNDRCAGFERADPVLSYLAGMFPAADYLDGLNALRADLRKTGKLATYFISGINHQHIWRPRFYEAAAGNVTIAEWTTDLLNGKLTHISP